METRGIIDIKELLIFYSGFLEPAIIKLYSPGIEYLKNLNINFKFININDHPALAEKYHVMATPLLIIRKENSIHKYVGLIDDLKKFISQYVLTSD